MQFSHPDCVVAHYRVSQHRGDRNRDILVRGPESAVRGERSQQMQRFLAAESSAAARQGAKLLEQFMPAHQGLVPRTIRRQRPRPAGSLKGCAETLRPGARGDARAAAHAEHRGGTHEVSVPLARAAALVRLHEAQGAQKFRQPRRDQLAVAQFKIKLGSGDRARGVPVRRTHPGAQACAIQFATGEEAERRERMGDGRYFREWLPALDPHQRLRCARRTQDAARINGLPDECGESLARAGCPGQHDEQACIGLSPHALGAPGGDAFGLLAPISAQQQFGCRVCCRLAAARQPRRAQRPWPQAVAAEHQNRAARSQRPPCGPAGRARASNASTLAAPSTRQRSANACCTLNSSCASLPAAAGAHINVVFAGERTGTLQGLPEGRAFSSGSVAVSLAVLCRHRNHSSAPTEHPRAAHGGPCAATRSASRRSQPPAASTSTLAHTSAPAASCRPRAQA